MPARKQSRLRQLFELVVGIVVIGLTILGLFLWFGVPWIAWFLQFFPSLSATV